MRPTQAGWRSLIRFEVNRKGDNHNAKVGNQVLIVCVGRKLHHRDGARLKNLGASRHTSPRLSLLEHEWWCLQNTC